MLWVNKVDPLQTQIINAYLDVPNANRRAAALPAFRAKMKKQVDEDAG